MIYQFEIFRNLTFIEKKTFRLHFAYSIIEGIILGVLVLNEFVFIKSMKGTDELLSVLFSFSVIVLVLSLFLNDFLKKIRNKRKILRITSLVTRLPLLLLAFFPVNSSSILYHIIFLGVFFFYYAAQPIFLPIINLFLKNNYKHENFGRLFSYSTMGNKMVMLVVTFLFGLLLDYDNYAFRYIFPITGILGVVSIFLLAEIRVDKYEGPPVSGLWKSIFSSLKEVKMILKTNRPFFDFQMGFMFYGFAFMSSAVMITLFYNNILHLNYSSTAFYKNFYNTIAIITLPFFGKLLGSISLKKFTILTFFFMFATILFTTLTEFFRFEYTFFGIQVFILLIIANVFYGLFASTMSLLWSIGSAYYCKVEDVTAYQSIHLGLTGLRGLIAPFVGIMIFNYSNFTVTFIFGMVCLIIGMVYVYFSKT